MVLRLRRNSVAVDPDLFESYDKALGATAELVRRDVELLFENYARANLGAPGLSVMEQGLVTIKHRYGDVAAAAAREFYSRARAAYAREHEGLEEYEPNYGWSVPDKFVDQDLSDAVGGREGTRPFDYDAMCRSMSGHMMKYPLMEADRTMMGNAVRDPLHPKWAFVPHAGACAWCCMVGSNGFVFNSKGSASAERHAHCTCPVVVDFDTENPALDGYDPDGMYDRFAEMGDTGGKIDWGTALSEARYYDREWIRTGSVPSVGYDSDATRVFKARDKHHGDEFRTATILASHGVSTTFWKDERTDKNDPGHVVGYADLSNGIELKTMNRARKYSSFDDYSRTAAKKECFRRIVFDVSENDFITDEQAREFVERAVRSRGLGAAFLIGHGRQLILVKA